ncbi:MAG: DUF1003 domain-containing protein [Patescibacteria group bacterium]
MKKRQLAPTDYLIDQLTVGDKLALNLSRSIGTWWFCLINLLLFILWISINSGLFQGLPIFDPYPYNLLTMLVSLEAIILTLVILMSQSRQERLTNQREERDYQVDVRAENEVGLLLEQLTRVEKKLNQITAQNSTKSS